MPKNKDFAIRIEIIDECLRNRFKQWSLQKLIDAVNDKLTENYGKSVGRRTIQGDLKYLKDEKQAPIEKVNKAQKFISVIQILIFQLRTFQLKMKRLVF